ncbi:DUF4282 domain-containing protein [Brevibacterium atlanticum]|uniref:DUF4282 domain-containing protein n=1 Tax=Brevibacterium atlanticum TaxID=2697563 RepID=UPI00141FAAA9|nr:DUF4282 domain-containing protein [Brevibacterium atlanticum]
MSTPQNPNDPISDQPDQPESNPGEQPDASQQGNSDYGQTGQTAQYDYSQPGQNAQNGYQQGTYDPNAYQQPPQQGSQQGAYAQPDAYQQGAYQQGYSQADGYQQAYAQPGAYGQPGYAQTPQSGTGEKGFFKSLFDFRFDSFIAVKWAGFIYIIAMIVAALSYIGTIVAGISAGVAAGSTMAYYSGGPSFNILPLILAIVFGWIIPALWVIGVRLVLELIVSNIKTAENTKRIADSVSR